MPGVGQYDIRYSIVAPIPMI